ncbi:MAG: class I SAM-dependent methyltransferase [Phycisphaerae bacterium]
MNPACTTSKIKSDNDLDETGQQTSGARLDRLRLNCNICGRQVDPDNPAAFAVFPCHVRAFLGEPFRLWRCDGCHTIHCLEIVDLDRYYAAYPFRAAELTFIWRIFYRNLARRFIRHGLNRRHTLLDYGCGNGLFGDYLRRRGFNGYHGYDPYGPPDGHGDAAVLDRGPFDFLLLQDVLEHVEDPRALLRSMDALLAPGGHILVGTPNADRIDLRRPEVFQNEVHAPYHLHIYTRRVLEDMGRERGWSPVAFYDRSYHDRPWFGMNTRAAKQYQRLIDGSFDAFFDPFDPIRAFTSPRFLFHAVFGYALSYRSDMTILFRKPDVR